MNFLILVNKNLGLYIIIVDTFILNIVKLEIIAELLTLRKVSWMLLLAYVAAISYIIDFFNEIIIMVASFIDALFISFKVKINKLFNLVFLNDPTTIYFNFFNFKLINN